jgi:hypothetical protein
MHAKNWLAGLGITAVVLLACTSAQAREVLVDFGENANNGQKFATNTANCGALDTVASSCQLDLRGNGTSTVMLGFGIDFGTGIQSAFTVSEDGVVSFGTASIFAFNSNLTSIAPFDTVFNRAVGEIIYSRGEADPEPDGAGNFSLAELVPAIHVSWDGPTDGAGTPIYTQLLLYSRGGGDFDLRLRYGNSARTVYANSGGLAGFSLGANVLSIVGPLAAANDYFYSFRGGACTVGCTPVVNVPEPGTLALFGLGALAAFGLRRRRISAG